MGQLIVKDKEAVFRYSAGFFNFFFFNIFS